jgi:hypothetical protein
MRRTLATGFLFMTTCVASVAHAQGNQNLRPWWAGVEAGDGELRLSSDQFAGSRMANFALGYFGGHNLGPRARVGLETNGWVIQGSDVNNPNVGENIWNVMGLVDAFPIRKCPLFVRAGAGLSLYHNHRPLEFGGEGWLWTGGLGYEIPITETFALVPTVAYASGNLNDVHNPTTVETGRHYSVFEFKAAVIFHLGKAE